MSINRIIKLVFYQLQKNVIKLVNIINYLTKSLFYQSHHKSMPKPKSSLITDQQKIAQDWQKTDLALWHSLVNYLIDFSKEK